MVSGDATVNDPERERLRGLAQRLTEADLRKHLPNGLTIAEVLIHLAFWDRYCAALLAQWRERGLTRTKTNYDAMNVAVHSLAAAVPSEDAPAMAVAAADAAAAVIAALPSRFAETIQAEGYGRLLDRAPHRKAHLDQIDQALAAGVEG